MRDAQLATRAFFTSREGGTSVAPYASLNLATHVGDDPVAVAANREVVDAAAGAPVSFMSPTHGTRVVTVATIGSQPSPADALITSTPGVALAVLAADCVPVLVHDRASGAVAAIHAGRQGIYDGVIDASIATLIDLRSNHATTGEMEASIGPAICGRCYEVPADMRDQFATRHPIATANTRRGKPAVDLPRAVRYRLEQLGISRIVNAGSCTAEDGTAFSHRRDGVTGRFVGVIVCP